MPKLAKKEYCAGCTACASVCPRCCISMSVDQDGFQCPRIDEEQCINCGLCEKTCPVLHRPEVRMVLPKAYAAYSVDEKMRLESSSGGIFSELARVVLRNGGAVYGAAYGSEFEVIHICIEQETDLKKLRGAKYAQSDLRGIFPEVKQRLDNGQKVLFSGTPCQVAGLKTYLRNDDENLVTVDFACHSVPSPLAWREYVKYRAEQDNGGELPHCINLRSKDTGWSRYRYSNQFVYGDNRSLTIRSDESLYMKLFIDGYINREACGNCLFKGYSRVSDITIGDFWGIWDIIPEMDDDKGISMVLLQSERGEEFFQQVSGRLECRAVTLEEAGRANRAILNLSQTHAKRNQALKWIREGQISRCEVFAAERKLPLIRKTYRAIKKLLRGGNNT